MTQRDENLQENGFHSVVTDNNNVVEKSARENHVIVQAPRWDPYLFVLAAIGEGQPKNGAQFASRELLTFCSYYDDNAVLDPQLQKLLVEEEGGQKYVKFPCNEMPILYPKRVALANQLLHDSIYNEGIKQIQNDHLPKILTMGGDHSIAIGSVSAISNLMEKVIENKKIEKKFNKPELVVFWIDAHADINTPSTTSSGHLHGCPVSILAGIDKESWKQLTDFDWTNDRLRRFGLDRTEFIQAKRIVYIGLRDVDHFEQDIIRDNNILEYPMTRFKAMQRNLEQLIAEALQQIDPNGDHPIHISFDIDGIDPIYANSTGTPVPDGIFPDEGVQIIEILKNTGRVVSMDLAEVNLALGDDKDVQNTLQTASKLIESFSRI